MTLLITVFAAIISTVIWYTKAPESKELYIGILNFLYWGASIMWFADAIFEYAQQGVLYFTPNPESMLNDTFLGFCVVALGLIIWLGVLLIKDPKHVVRDSLLKKK